jgi:hypothetical protein
MTKPFHPLLRAPLRALLAACLVATVVVVVPVAASDGATPDPSASAEPTPEPGPSTGPGPSAEPTASPDPTPDPSSAADPSGVPGTSPSPDPSASPDPGAGSSPGPTPPPTVVVGTWLGSYNLYRSGAWVRQYQNYTCTAASAQTMLNLIRKRADRSLVTQMRIIRYAQLHDHLRFSRGTDPSGWAQAMTYFGGGRYTWRVFPTRSQALRFAAARMLATGKPAGLLVWRGRHAWTMTGFTSLTDPRTDPAVIVTGVFVAPPLVGVDPRPNTYIPTASLGTFARYQERDGLQIWLGRWVVVAP